MDEGRIGILARAGCEVRCGFCGRFWFEVVESAGDFSLQLTCARCAAIVQVTVSADCIERTILRAPRRRD